MMRDRWGETTSQIMHSFLITTIHKVSNIVSEIRNPDAQELYLGSEDCASYTNLTHRPLPHPHLQLS
jgi:hypothetical protein